MATTARPEARDALFRMISGYQLAQLVHVVAVLRIADLLVLGPRSVDDLAAQTGANADRLYRVLRALGAVGVLEELEGHSFALTPLSDLLRSDHPESLRPMSIFLGGVSYRTWGELLYGVMSGETPAEKVLGMPGFAYLRRDSEAGEAFDATMTVISRRHVQSIVEGYDFSDALTVVDVGGGQGMLLAGVLKANPHLHGILFDQPSVVAAAKRTLEGAGVSERCELVGGDFFRAVPPGGDIYMLRSIIHDWDDMPATTILANCERAMAEDGRLLVMESVIDAGEKSVAAKFLDVQMLVTTGGRERTVEEFEQLFAAAGLEVGRVIPVGVDGRIVEGVR
ncbi:MAG TPA: methyltransferase [Gemmatimonadaceae bacterium]|nr:methyltransferase [Gemmatimonadaceae bacterium]